MEANGYRNVLSLNYEKRHTKQGGQTNLSLKEESYGGLAAEMR